jgi:shikimate kinase
MVEFVDQPPSNLKPGKRQAWIVELVGPVGAGKTTLAQALIQCNKSIQLIPPPYFRRVQDIPFFVKNTVSMLPVFFSMKAGKKGEQFTLREIAWMVMLNGWHHELRQHESSQDTMVILDQGPVFLLNELISYGSGNFKNQRLKIWLASMLKNWAVTLNCVVWLDAPNTVLFERIRSREKWHLVKSKNELEVIKFLDQYRRSYANVLSLLEANVQALNILRFDTNQDSVNSIVKKLLVEFGGFIQEEEAVLYRTTEPVHIQRQASQDL